MTGCNGSCCSSFPMVGAYGAMTQRQLVNARDLNTYNDMSLEYDKYVDMLIVIGFHPGGGDLFTCRCHDPVTKRCTEYAGRPRLCSTYPYRDVCKHCWLTIEQLKGHILA